MEIVNKTIAKHFVIKETLECTLPLNEEEFQGIKEGKCTMQYSWVSIENGQLICRDVNIPGTKSYERTLLASKEEIDALLNGPILQGQTLIPEYSIRPVRIYLKDDECKMEIALCRFKEYEKEETDLSDKEEFERD